jgi:hypothetical protein
MDSGSGGRQHRWLFVGPSLAGLSVFHLRRDMCMKRYLGKRHGKFVGRVFARPCRIIDGCWTSQLSLDRFARTERRNGTTMDDEGGRL